MQQAEVAPPAAAAGLVDHQVHSRLAGGEVAEAHRGVGGTRPRERVGTEVVVPAPGQAPRHLARAAGLRDLRIVAAPQRGKPLVVHRLERHAEGDAEYGLEVLGPVPVVEQVEDLVGPAVLGQVEQERLTFLVHQHRARDGLALRQRQRLARDHRVAQQSLGVGVPVGAAELGQALGEPQRRQVVLAAMVLAHHPRQLLDHVGMGELVTRDPGEPRPGSGVRQQHAAFDELGEPAGALGDQARRGVGLLEQMMDRVEQERDGPARRQAEAPVVLDAHAVREHHQAPGQALFLGVVVQAQVGSGEHRPLERLVLDLVLAERLGVCGSGGREQQRGEERGRDGARESHHGSGANRGPESSARPPKHRGRVERRPRIAPP